MESFLHWFSFTIPHITASHSQIINLYAHLVGIPIRMQDPYSGLEKDLKDIIIAATTPLNIMDIKSHMTSKKGVKGLPAKFLIEKARYIARIKDISAFEDIFALLIYGMFLSLTLITSLTSMQSTFS